MPPRVSFLPSVLGSLCVAGSLCLLTGCNGKVEPTHVATYPVTASITFEGKPMPGAFISLHPKNPQPDVPNPRANVDRDGKVSISTFSTGDGAPEGEYVLTAVWYKLVKQGADSVAGPNVIPAKYGSPETSDLVIKVNPSENVIPPITL